MGRKKDAEDLTGTKHGLLTVQSFIHGRADARSWECRCECGGTKMCKAADLKQGRVKSCGCLVSHRKCGMRNLTGQKFGRLTAVRTAGKTNGGQYVWHCVCDCGATKDVAMAHLVAMTTRSCGCLRYKAAEARRTHGGRQLKEYHVWFTMRQRCSNPNSNCYERYGGKGITVCDRWLGRDGFANFLADMGMRPSPEHSLDRIDNEKGYEPGNVRWATKSEQARNRKSNRWFSVRGQRLCLADCTALSGLHRMSIHDLMKNGWTMELILDTTLRCKANAAEGPSPDEPEYYL